MLTGIHFLLTYACTFECDHCFVYSAPNAPGTFTAQQIIQVLGEAQKIGTVEWIYFEGGEPLLFYPLLLHGIRQAAEMGFKVGVVSNAYGAISDDVADLWLRPLAELGLAYLSISDDAFHYGEMAVTPARRALAAAERLGIPTSPIAIEAPSVTIEERDTAEKGQPVIGGGVMFRGRAADKLTEGLPRRAWTDLVECPYEELAYPSRVHVDAYGNVHLCQGLSMGNLWQTPLSELVQGYDAVAHPISGPLLRGGPAQLARERGMAPADAYVDECHMCYSTRRALLGEYPDLLAPRQVYGFCD